MKLKELESLMQVCCRSSQTSRGGVRRRTPHAAPAAACPLPARRCCTISPRPPVQDIAPFEDPKIELEQYPTGPHIAARMLYTVRPRLSGTKQGSLISGYASVGLKQHHHTPECR